MSVPEMILDNHSFNVISSTNIAIRSKSVQDMAFMRLEFVRVF